MMNTYEAIMRAANHIERNPSSFDFDKTDIPAPDCGTPGCALGWIGCFAGITGGIEEVADHGEGNSLLKIDQKIFYRRMDELAGALWIWSATKCATGMRLYAEKYHGHEKRNFARELEQKLLANPLELASTCSR